MLMTTPSSRRVRFLLSISLLLGTAFAGPASLAAADRSLVSAGSGLKVESDPAGAEVLVDGIRRGTTPLSISGVAPGRHTLLLRKDGYWNRELVFVVEQGKALYFYLELSEAYGYLNLRVDSAPVPEGTPELVPSITVDSERKEIGVLPLVEGYHDIRIAAFGYEPQRRSVYIYRGEWTTLTVIMERALFRASELRLSRGVFSPLYSGSLGSTTIGFGVSTAGSGTLTIRDAEGSTVFVKRWASFTDIDQSARWDGRDAGGTPLPDGEYRIELEAAGLGDPSPQVRSASVRLDGERILPLTGSAAEWGGFLLAPRALTAPAGSVSADAALLAGRPYGEDTYLAETPVAFGLRYAPATGLELSGEARIYPNSGAGSFGGGLGVKYAFASPKSADGSGLRAAAALRWSVESDERTGSDGASGAFGFGGGAELALPLEWGYRGFVALLAPGALWRGAWGVPDFADWPSATLSGAIAWEDRRTSVAASFRSELDVVNFVAGGTLDGSGIAEEPLLCALELRRALPEEAIIMAGALGFWRRGADTGLYAGAGLGFRF